MLAEAQGQGVGRALLQRAFPPTDVHHRSILATSDPAALSRYLRQGFRSSTAIYAFEGDPRRRLRRRPAGCSCGRSRSCRSRTGSPPSRRIDGDDPGSRRDEDHAWLGERGPGWLLMRDEVTVGYAYGGARQGPIATLDARDMPAAIGLVELDALRPGGEPVSLTVPLANVAATDYLLARRYRLDPFTMHLLEDQPVVAADRYIFTSPPFFL